MTDNSNAKKMSVEELLVQNIKDKELFTLIGDEDALTQIAKRAIHEALFQPRTVRDGHYNTRQEASLVVSAAQEVARTYADRAVKELIDGIMADPEQRKLVREAVIALLPHVIIHRWKQELTGIVTDGGNAALAALRSFNPQQPVAHAFRQHAEQAQQMSAETERGERHRLADDVVVDGKKW